MIIVVFHALSRPTDLVSLDGFEPPLSGNRPPILPLEDRDIETGARCRNRTSTECLRNTRTTIILIGRKNYLAVRTVIVMSLTMTTMVTVNHPTAMRVNFTAIALRRD
jgi:hypothetical protein